MDIKEFSQLPCYDSHLDIKDVKVGDKFLTGFNMISQRESKTLGQDISWYEVTAVNEKGQISYSPRYGVLYQKMGDK